jgi:predicted nucleic acid-binding protein
VIFDSCVLIDALNGHGAAQDMIKQSPHRHICAVTRTEILAGCGNAVAIQSGLKMLNRFKLCVIDAALADCAGSMRTVHRLRIADALIVAAAKGLGLPLVSRDKSILAVSGVQCITYAL